MAMRCQRHKGKHFLIFICVPSLALQEFITQMLKKQEQGVAGVSSAQCSRNWFPSEVLTQDGQQNITKALISS